MLMKIMVISLGMLFVAMIIGALLFAAFIGAL